MNGKYYYENALANPNITTHTNITWVCDISNFDLPEDEKLFVFLCLDIHTNVILSSVVRT